jgi:hypothetical protein
MQFAGQVPDTSRARKNVDCLPRSAGYRKIRILLGVQIVRGTRLYMEGVPASGRVGVICKINR